MSCLFNSQLEYQHRFVPQKGMPKFICKIVYCFKNILHDHQAFENIHPKAIHDFFNRKARRSVQQDSRNLSCWKAFKLRTAMVSYWSQKTFNLL